MGRKWLVNYNAGKTHLVLFDQSNKTGTIDVIMDGSVPEEKSSFKMLGLSFSFKLDWHSCIISLLLKIQQENWSLDSFYQVAFY